MYEQSVGFRNRGKAAGAVRAPLPFLRTWLSGVSVQAASLPFES